MSVTVLLMLFAMAMHLYQNFMGNLYRQFITKNVYKLLVKHIHVFSLSLNSGRIALQPNLNISTVLDISACWVCVFPPSL